MKNNKTNKKRRKLTIHLAILFALMMFSIMLATGFLVMGVMLLLYELGVLSLHGALQLPLVIFALTSLIVGTMIAFVFCRRPLSPLQEVMDATDKIAAGDYSVRIDPWGIEDFRLLGEKFNNMASELQSVEMLRSDFVNNFSHEFKTPIVSIRGYAKALKWADLSDEERNEYLDIIISESERLSELSNNVLYLSKIENQTIITDVARINVTEQIRRVVALLYEKLAVKNLSVSFDADEEYVNANDELLKEVWINLLDNAVKFSPENGDIEISVKKEDGYMLITVSDEGPGISDEAKKHVFEKFYQGENSHSVKGNGLGLSIAARIVELHGGKIEIGSPQKGSQFIVRLKA